jgi:hypothetical protein
MLRQLRQTFQNLLSLTGMTNSALQNTITQLDLIVTDQHPATQ